MSKKIEIEYVPVESCIPYDKNPRRNGQGVDVVARSIKENGFKVPIILDKNNIIIAGHTRLLAAKKLEMKEVPVIWADDLTEEQVKAFRIMDNKASEYTEWDYAMLRTEILELKALNVDLNLTGFTADEISSWTEEEINSYSDKIIIPKYEPKVVKPKVEELVRKSKAFDMIEKINNSKVDEKTKDFLRLAAHRHLVFSYKDIADFYAHSEKEVQELMEDSALVLIDFKKAVESGFVEFTKNLFEDGEL